MTSIQLVNKQSFSANKNKGLVQVFRTFRKRYLNVGKKPDPKKFLPEVVYRTMHLEGDQIN